jgi:hypothetical protein
MRHGKYLAFGLTLGALSVVFVHGAAAPQDIPRPKKDIPKQAAPKRTASKPTAPGQAVPKSV